MIRFAVFSGAQVTKTRSPQITGDECPLPGRVVLQLKSFSEKVDGKLPDEAMPEPFGPRKRVHSCAFADSANSTMTAAVNSRVPVWVRRDREVRFVVCKAAGA